MSRLICDQTPDCEQAKDCPHAVRHEPTDSCHFAPLAAPGDECKLSGMYAICTHRVYRDGNELDI